MNATEHEVSRLLRDSHVQFDPGDSPTKIRFRATSTGRFEIVECCHSLFHFLCRALVYEAGFTARLRSFANGNAVRDWREVVEAFCETQGIGEGFWVDTYDDANLLSSNLRYYQVDDLVFLRVHSGTDIRSGYGAPVVFREIDDRLYRNGVAKLSSNPNDDSSAPAWLTTDAGETWAAANPSNYRDLTEYPATVIAAERGTGKLFVDAFGNGFCPLTHERLHLASV